MDNNSEKYDVVIIGAGPAGMAASLWCADLGLTSFVIEQKGELGGQLLQTHGPITNYPGVRTENGREMRDILSDQLKRSNKTGPHLNVSSRATGLDLKSMAIALENGGSVHGRAIVIATGVRRRRLGIPGENEFVGRGILESGMASREKVAGKRVVIVGGGDAAFENAAILAEHALSLTLLHRSNSFSARAEFVTAARVNPKVTIVENASLSKINGGDVLGSVIYHDLVTAETRSIAADALLIRVGVEPNSEIVPPEIVRDQRGYIVTDKMCMTNIPRIFAIGDVANPQAPTLSGAAGNAATAIKAISGMMCHTS